MKKRILSIVLTACLMMGILPTASLADDGKYTVIYTDGVEDAEIFSDQTHSNLSVGNSTPAFSGNHVRYGYEFDGWSPAVADTVKAEDADENNRITYTATWRPADRNQNGIPDVEEKFTVIYTDGAIGADCFDDQIFQNLSVGDHMPELIFYPARSDCIFNGWDHTLNDIVEAPAEGNVIIYTALWIRGNQYNPSPLTQEVKISYYDETVDEPVAEVNGVVVAFDATYVPAYLISENLPDGYRVKNGLSDVPLGESASVTVSVIKDVQTSGVSSSRKYILKYDTNEGNAISSEKKSRKWTKDFEDLPVPARKGYGFAGWYYNEQLTQKVEDDVAVDTTTVTLYAKWVRVSELLFTDVDVTDYYYDAVLWAAENGMTGGVDDIHFAPNAPCTRAQIVTFLWRAAGCPEPENLSSFTDVPVDSYYGKAVAWAVENGITTGNGSGMFSPDATCTRAQAMTFIYRSTQILGGGMQGAWMFQNPFEDVDLENYYGEAVMWAVAEGITTGTDDAHFSPEDDCTRGQIVAFLWRCMK